jgi:hypothetical protein
MGEWTEVLGQQSIYYTFVMLSDITTDVCEVKVGTMYVSEVKVGTI